jgi:hypothetical protein
MAPTLRTKPGGAIGAPTSHASRHAFVSTSPQFFCSSDGTVLLIHGLSPPGLTSNHRGWGIYTHSIFTRRPQGEPAAFSIFPSPYADRRTETAFGRSLFGHLRDRQNYPPRSKISGNDSRLSGLDRSALGGAERAEHPTRNQPPSSGVLSGGPGGPTRGPLLTGIDGE